MKLISSPLTRRCALLCALALVFSFGPTNHFFFAPLHAEFSPDSTDDTDPITGKPLIKTPSGLKYVDYVVGTGPVPKKGDQVTVNYTGRLANGKVFDSSSAHGKPFTYIQGVTPLIAGWTEGVSTMKQGGSRKLIIPANLGYGLQGQGDVIPPNATLTFEIDLLSVTPAGAAAAPAPAPAHP